MQFVVPRERIRRLRQLSPHAAQLVLFLAHLLKRAHGQTRNSSSGEREPHLLVQGQQFRPLQPGGGEAFVESPHEVRLSPPHAPVQLRHLELQQLRDAETRS